MSRRAPRSVAQMDWRFLAALVLATLVVLALWSSPLAYPIRLFVTLTHELSHAAAALVTGGQVLSVSVAPDGSGLTTTRGGNLLLVASAGYLGSVLVGALLLNLAKRPGAQRITLQVTAVSILLTAFLFIRDPFSGAVTLGLAAVLWLLARLKPSWPMTFVLCLLAALQCLYAVLDLNGLFALSLRGRPTDAALMERATGIPALFWSLLWMAVGGVFLLWVGRRLFSR